MIRKAYIEDAPVLGALAAKLWPEHSAAQMSLEIAQQMDDADAAWFLAFDAEESIGFAQCQLRHDYVEGTDSSPVGYLEGIYVEKEHRRQGIAGALLHACESWAGERGCTEFASDCEFQNTQSLDFHLRLGFQEANRIICFTKKL